MWFGHPTDAIDDAQSGFGAAEFSTGGMQFVPAFEIIGSEGFQSLKLGRKFIGSELKRSYFEQACSNLKNAKSQKELSLA